MMSWPAVWPSLACGACRPRQPSPAHLVIPRSSLPLPALPAAVPRTSGRRTVLQWNTDCVIDPRTGAAVTEVSPGTFCTQVRGRGAALLRKG